MMPRAFLARANASYPPEARSHCSAQVKPLWEGVWQVVQVWWRQVGQVKGGVVVSEEGVVVVGAGR